MVRFSDIVKLRDKATRDEKPEAKGPEEERLWFSDTQMLQIKEGAVPDKAMPTDDARAMVAGFYEKFLERAQEIRERIKADKGISPSPILSDLHRIIEKNVADELYDYALSIPDDYDKMLVHTVDVTFAAMKVGKGMNYDTKRLLELGLAAFLENVGMYRIPDNVLNKEGKLNEIELKVIRNHPVESAEILSRLGSRYRWLAETALQVHERMDGTGYPKGLKGDEISELAYIVGLIDTYAAMIKNRPYREKFIQTDAIRSIISFAKGKFPPRILKVFLTQISLFPVNTYVRLNNKSIGRVVATNKDQPMKPMIEILYDGQGNRLQKREIIHLSENPLLYIVEGIDGDRISGEQA
ncbi:MAG: HD domain-containing protein [Deltaproteobacteria bacterium]|nr:HD domain-containing protein [Deltaproteobacteria bacterium]